MNITMNEVMNIVEKQSKLWIVQPIDVLSSKKGKQYVTVFAIATINNWIFKMWMIFEELNERIVKMNIRRYGRRLMYAIIFVIYK